MTLTCTWVKDPAGYPVMKWMVDEGPMRAPAKAAEQERRKAQ